MSLQAARDVPEVLRAIEGDEALARRPMMTFYEAGQKVRTYSYGEVATEVARRAGWLQSIGVRAGDHVAVLSPNCPEVPFFTLALASLGAVSVPLNPGSPPSEWDYVMDHARVRGVLATEELLARLEGSAVALAFRSDIRALPADVPAPRPVERCLEDALAIILYTSGTTARPKGVGLAHRNILFSGRSMAQRYGLYESTQLTVLPLYHAHAFNFGLMTALMTRGHLVLCDRFDPLSWLEIVQRERVTVTSAFPGLLPMLMRIGAHRDKLPLLRCILVTAAPLPSELARTFEDQVQIPLLNGWGLSESTSLATSMEPDQDPALHRRLLRDFEVPCMGPPLEGVELTVLDPAGHPLPAGHKGELCVAAGSTVMQGYYNDPEATRLAIRDGWLHSGDEGFYVEEEGKKVFFITGRIKEIIIRGGENFSPLGLEELVVHQHADLFGKFVILGFAHDVYGEEVGAYVESAGDEALVARVQAAFGALPAELRPKVILHGRLPIPRTHTGKVQRRKLESHFRHYRKVIGATRVALLDAEPAVHASAEP
jgi:long-chain acyl-CoA synthetase